MRTLEEVAAYLLKVLGDNPIVLSGKLLRAGGDGSNVLVALDNPYRGLNQLPAIAVSGCSAPGAVRLCLGSDNKTWYAFGANLQVPILRERTIERSYPQDSEDYIGEIAYIYSYLETIGGVQKRRYWIAGYADGVQVLAFETTPGVGGIVQELALCLDYLGSGKWSVDVSLFAHTTGYGTGTFQRITQDGVAWTVPPGNTQIPPILNPIGFGFFSLYGPFGGSLVDPSYITPATGTAVFYDSDTLYRVVSVLIGTSLTPPVYSIYNTQLLPLTAISQYVGDRAELCEFWYTGTQERFSSGSNSFLPVRVNADQSAALGIRTTRQVLFSGGNFFDYYYSNTISCEYVWISGAGYNSRNRGVNPVTVDGATVTNPPEALEALGAISTLGLRSPSSAKAYPTAFVDVQQNTFSAIESTQLLNRAIALLQVTGSPPVIAPVPTSGSIETQDVNAEVLVYGSNFSLRKRIRTKVFKVPDYGKPGTSGYQFHMASCFLRKK